MARKQRIHYNGALYHVIVRGNNRENVLVEDEDKQFYMDTVKRYKEQYGFKLYAYCIMDNHAHMLIQVEEIPLSKIMQGIQLVYTKRYNRKNKRTGHVFEQRYKSILCDMDGYIVHLTKYIHLNPVKAGITKDINYKWSSYSDYKRGSNELVDVDFVLNMLMTDKSRAIKAYTIYMNAELEDIGKKEYELKEQPISDSGEEAQRKNIEALIEEIIKSNKVSQEGLISKSRVNKISKARKEIILRAEKECEINSTELAKRLNVTIATVSKVKSRSIS